MSFISVASDGTIYTTSVWPGPSELNAFNPDGTWKWATLNRGNLGDVSPAAIAADGTIYFGESHYFSAVNPTNGTFKWMNGTSSQVWGQGAVIGPDGTIYVEAFGNTNFLYAFNADGSIKWTFRMSPYVSGPNAIFKQSACALAADGEIYVSDIDGMLYSLAPNGATNWAYQTGLGSLFPPIIGPDGTVYVTSYEQAYLLAFYGPAPVACASWPQHRKNARNTAAGATANLSSPIKQTNGFQFTITGISNMPVCPCATTDFAAWTNLGQIVLTNGTANFTDTGTSNYQYRFYRVWPQ
jgi:outer membrane protein assembly factor BamB